MGVGHLFDPGTKGREGLELGTHPSREIFLTPVPSRFQKLGRVRTVARDVHYGWTGSSQLSVQITVHFPRSHEGRGVFVGPVGVECLG